MVLGGCSVLDTVGDWFSSSGKKSNLRGVRIPVMSLDSDLKVDATIAAIPVVLPPPYRNADWPQPGGYASNAMYHLAAPGRLRVELMKASAAGVTHARQVYFAQAIGLGLSPPWGWIGDGKAECG